MLLVIGSFTNFLLLRNGWCVRVYCTSTCLNSMLSIWIGETEVVIFSNTFSRIWDMLVDFFRFSICNLCK